MIVCYIMDNAKTVLTPSEAYFALAWCSESDGFNSMIQMIKIS
jgi:hypothetical protein